MWDGDEDYYWFYTHLSDHFGHAMIFDVALYVLMIDPRKTSVWFMWRYPSMAPTSSD
ncbi:unnamed protein product [Urochloa humidicola]